MDQLTSAQLSEWEAYDRLDPIGAWREDYRLAYLSSLVTNIALSMGGEKNNKKYTTPIDFMLNWDINGKVVEPKKQSVDELKQILKGIARAQNKPKRVKRPPASVAKKEKI